MPFAQSRPLLRLIVGTLALCALAACAPEPAAMTEAEVAEYEADIGNWRADRIERLTAETGWVTLVGLFWVDDGSYRLGSAEGSEILLPTDKAPAELALLTVDGDAVRLEVTEGAEVLHEGEPVESLELADDSEGAPTSSMLGS